MDSSARQPSSISSAARSCRDRFRECSAVNALMKSHWAENRLSDFNLWDAGVGASINKPNSLDLRLQHNPAARKVVLGSLGTLAAWTAKCRELCELHAGSDAAQPYRQGDAKTRPPVSQPGVGLSRETRSSDKSACIVSESDTFDHAPPTVVSISPQVQSANSESADKITLEEAMKGVEALLSMLVDTGFAIRQAGTASRLREADRTFHKRKGNYSSEEEHLTFIFRLSALPRVRGKPTDDTPPEIDISAIFNEEGKGAENRSPQPLLREEQRILLDANIKRRDRFIFARHRGSHLNLPAGLQQLTVPDSKANSTPRQPGLNMYSQQTQGTLQPSSLLVGTTKPGAEPQYPKSALSVTGTAQLSNFPSEQFLEKAVKEVHVGPPPTAIALRAEYPTHPKIREGANAFQCPYCCFTLSKDMCTAARWRKHVSEDLQPYTCFLPNCPQGNSFFNTLDAWKSHMDSEHQTRNAYICLICQVSINEEQVLLQHLRNNHKDAVSPAHPEDLLELIRMCQSYSAPKLDLCPICSIAKEEWREERNQQLTSNLSQTEETFLYHVGKCLHDFSLRALPHDTADALKDSSTTASTRDYDRLSLSALSASSFHSISMDNIKEGERLTEGNLRSIPLVSRSALKMVRVERIIEWIVSLLLSDRIEQTASINDLNRTIDANTLVFNASPDDHPDRASILRNVSEFLSSRFERTESIDDLNHAIDVANQAVDATPQDHPDRANQLNNLGIFLGTRFERTGSIDDLNRAVEVADIAVNTTPQDHPDRANRLNNLGIFLGTRFERTGSMDDLNRAVEVANMAVDTTPQDHPDRAGRLNNLRNRLGMEFKRTGLMKNLNRAVEVADMAVDATPQDHPDRAMYLNSLGSWLGTRFERTGSMEDLNRAVEVSDIAVDATPQDHPNRAMHLNSLGNWLGTRFERTGLIEDLNRALSCYKEGWACHTSPLSMRIILAQSAANILAFQLKWEEASGLLEGAVKLLPIISPRRLENNDKQHILGQFSGLASKAAAICLEAGKDKHQALELLELGRCVIAGLLLEMRTDISNLEQQHPMLAAEFKSLQNKLDLPPSETTLLGNTESLWRVQANRRLKADERFKKLVTEIRGQPSFQNFLLPPTHEELMAAASQGPVVIINVTSYRCDAFLIQHHQIKVLALPNLDEDELKKRIHQQSVRSASTLEWLWTAAAGPILDALGYQHISSDDNWPHLWWIPTGALSRFPIHAAGFHTKRSTGTVLDRVMSSYTSSVKALIYGRRHSLKSPAGSGLEQALLVAMQETPGLASSSALPFATKEVEMLADFCPSLGLKAVMPPRRKEEVLVHLRACKIFHFAGHGRSDLLDPAQSCLLLDDWNKSPLTVGDLRDFNIQESSPFLGYLSACSTSVNRVDRLVDEGIHLASAFQLAGFRHVIGTLWEVSDSHCVDAARVVYETIRDEGMTDIAVCRGLHRAIRQLRDGGMGSIKELRDGGRMESIKGARGAELVDEELSDESELQSPLYWTPYIHFGV